MPRVAHEFDPKLAEGQVTISKNVASWAQHTATMAGDAAAAAKMAAKQAHEAQLSADNTVSELHKLMERQGSQSLDELPEEEEMGDTPPDPNEKFEFHDEPRFDARGNRIGEHPWKKEVNPITGKAELREDQQGRGTKA